MKIDKEISLLEQMAEVDIGVYMPAKHTLHEELSRL